MSDQATILAVDDTSLSLALLVRILTTAGYKVRPADSGELALASIAESLPDLILLDVVMKGIDGLEVCRRLKASEETRHIPIIMVSAFADVREWVEGLQLGAADYITKPFQTEELLLRVKTQLALRRSYFLLQQQTTALCQANEQLQSEIVNRHCAEDELRKSLVQAEQSRRAICSTLEEQKRTEAERERLLLWQNSVNLAQQSLLAHVPLSQKLKSITDHIVQIFDADFCRVWLIRPGDLCECGCVHSEVSDGPHVCHFRDKCLHLMASAGR